MPATRSSVLDRKPNTELPPGSTGIRLKEDPYYGLVEVGPAPTTAAEFEKKEREKIAKLPAGERPAAEDKLGRELAKRKLAGPEVEPAATRDDQAIALGFLEQTIEDGVHVLDGEEQSHVEVLTGKRLQQKANDKAPEQPEVLPPDTPQRGAVSDNPMEPPERERDKTKAAKPGESVKPGPGDPKG